MWLTRLYAMRCAVWRVRLCDRRFRLCSIIAEWLMIAVVVAVAAVTVVTAAVRIGRWRRRWRRWRRWRQQRGEIVTRMMMLLLMVVEVVLSHQQCMRRCGSHCCCGGGRCDHRVGGLWIAGAGAAAFGLQALGTFASTIALMFASAAHINVHGSMGDGSAGRRQRQRQRQQQWRRWRTNRQPTIFAAGRRTAAVAAAANEHVRSAAT